MQSTTKSVTYITLRTKKVVIRSSGKVIIKSEQNHPHIVSFIIASLILARATFPLPHTHAHTRALSTNEKMERWREGLTGVVSGGGGRAAEGGSRRGGGMAVAGPEGAIELGASSLGSISVKVRSHRGEERRGKMRRGC